MIRDHQVSKFFDFFYKEDYFQVGNVFWRLISLVIPTRVLIQIYQLDFEEWDNMYRGLLSSRKHFLKDYQHKLNLLGYYIQISTYKSLRNGIKLNPTLRDKRVSTSTHWEIWLIFSHISKSYHYSFKFHKIFIFILSPISRFLLFHANSGFKFWERFPKC